ncbi:MAG: hypothetical protein CL908_18975 [Deltaproteobacteria bacterium]|nr:hypothetical protein [Deltaproteobacteria bacterium]
MPNHAAVVSITGRSLRRVLVLCVALLLLSAGAVSALPGIDLSVPPAPTSADECPQLIQIKYPFISCSNGQIGQVSDDETWENTRQIPTRSSDWSEGEGFLGPDLHQD